MMGSARRQKIKGSRQCEVHVRDSVHYSVHVATYRYGTGHAIEAEAARSIEAARGAPDGHQQEGLLITGIHVILSEISLMCHLGPLRFGGFLVAHGQDRG